MLADWSNGITSFARWRSWRRPAHPDAHRVLCAALDAVLCAQCAVLGAVQFARFAVPDGALSRTLAHLWAASWARRERAWWRSGASAGDTANIAGEAVRANTAAYPRKASALRRHTCFGFDFHFSLPVADPFGACHITPKDQLLI